MSSVILFFPGCSDIFLFPNMMHICIELDGAQGPFIPLILIKHIFLQSPYDGFERSILEMLMLHLSDITMNTICLITIMVIL